MSRTYDLLKTVARPRIWTPGVDVLAVEPIIQWGQELIDVAESVGEWFAARENIDSSGVESVTKKRTNSQLLVERVTDIRLGRFRDGLQRAVTQGIAFYLQHNPYFKVVQHSGYDLLRYEEGQAYGLHADACSARAPGRLLSVLIYLNDDYEGGELYFPRQDVTIKPVAGTMVIFPSIATHPHEAKPVTRGTKYAIVTWAS